MFTTSEFSRISGLSIEMLRLLKQEQVLSPTAPSDDEELAAYDDAQLPIARAIYHLGKIEIPLERIRALLDQTSGKVDIAKLLSQQEGALPEKRIKTIVAQEAAIEAICARDDDDIRETKVDRLLVAGIRMRGKYSDCGKAYGKIGWQYGRQLSGPAMMLHYDKEYKENDADFEACFPIRQGASKKGIEVHELEGGRLVSLTHRGPYETLTGSYARLLRYVRARHPGYLLPTRESFVKGPGWLFKGDPEKYLTELQILVA
ncbi:MerR family transcriptional regulator [Blastopirellula sp. JC732]|uniref:MerR family transcriptional regulator n=1 Tax=Blastopirellula sediminis TaxID=2894196 RepID=A0A9X1MPL4_9BACT|nr:MerR family transcriptional regulator [Blastopirellula sediminis]MCC9606668.1 MerR family transcriptional regulator [Blastopirellula sediminis]MCC9630035.1 MerR family transcriptional regulator [Blastopirellula sediminis]